MRRLAWKYTLIDIVKLKAASRAGKLCGHGKGQKPLTRAFGGPTRWGSYLTPTYAGRFFFRIHLRTNPEPTRKGNEDFWCPVQGATKPTDTDHNMNAPNATPNDD